MMAVASDRDIICGCVGGDGLLFVLCSTPLLCPKQRPANSGVQITVFNVRTIFTFLALHRFERTRCSWRNDGESIGCFFAQASRESEVMLASLGVFVLNGSSLCN